MSFDHWKTTEPDPGCPGYGLSETEQAAGKMLNAMQEEIDALQAEVTMLRQDIAMRPGSLTLLYRIRAALGFNEYYGLSGLADDALRLMRQHAEMLAALKASEVEYENLEADAPTDAGCIECTVGTVPNRLNTGLCAHHLRVRAIAKVEARL